jgi:hypothetical protein
VVKRNIYACLLEALAFVCITLELIKHFSIVKIKLLLFFILIAQGKKLDLID